MSEQVVSPRIYLAVFAVLILLTATTTFVAFVDAGPWNAVLALVIALFKASLVLFFFMHLKYGPRLNLLVFAGAILWLGILLVATYSDFATRGGSTVFPRLIG